MSFWPCDSLIKPTFIDTSIARTCPFCQNKFVKLSTYSNHNCKGPSNERRKHVHHVRLLERKKRQNGTDGIRNVQDVSPPQESTCISAVAPQLPNHAATLETLVATTSGQPPKKPPLPNQSPWENIQSVKWNEIENTELDGVILGEILQELGHAV